MMGRLKSERAQLVYQFVQMGFLVDMPLTGVRPHERYFRQLMAFGGALHALTPRMRRNVEPRHVKRHQAEPVMVQVARRRAGTTIAHSAEVVHSLVRADRCFVAHGGSGRTYIEDCPVAECAPGRIGIIDNHSEAFRACRRTTPDEWWRHVLAFARIEFWSTAIGWKGCSL